MTEETNTGWFVDPSGRHAARYFAAGQPTDLVRDGEQQSVDPVGDRPSPPTRANPTSDGTEIADADVQTLIDAETASRRHGQLWLAMSAVGIVIILAVAVVLVATSGDDTKSAAAPNTTLSADARASQQATTLRQTLCSSSSSASCSVDSSAGVIEVYMSEYAVDESGLVTAGTESGFWNAADVARMLHTRALDGTQRTADGKASWTFHPDDGLQIVIDVSSKTT